MRALLGSASRFCEELVLTLIRNLDTKRETGQGTEDGEVRWAKSVQGQEGRPDPLSSDSTKDLAPENLTESSTENLNARRDRAKTTSPIAPLRLP